MILYHDPSKYNASFRQNTNITLKSISYLNYNSCIVKIVPEVITEIQKVSTIWVLILFILWR